MLSHSVELVISSSLDTHQPDSIVTLGYTGIVITTLMWEPAGLTGYRMTLLSKTTTITQSSDAKARHSRLEVAKVRLISRPFLPDPAHITFSAVYEV